MSTHLLERLEQNQILDAFLLSAGAVQIVEDHLQRDTLTLRRAAGAIGGTGSWALRALAGAAEHLRRPREHAAISWCTMARQLRDDLAGAVMGDGLSEKHRRHAVTMARALRELMPGLPARLRRELLRMPGCFRSFDMQPADTARLAEAYAPSVSGRPVLVVGVRTSGSYLAPLVAAALHALGTEAVTITARPGHPLLPADRGALRRVLAAGGTVAVVDDPPGSGAALRSVVDLLTSSGAPAAVITLLLPLFDGAVPGPLADIARVELPFTRWAVHRLLTPDAILEALSCLTGETFTDAERLPADTVNGSGRKHLRATYRVRTLDGDQRLIGVLGTGIGYLGRHALAVAAAVPDHVPHIYGVRNGLVFREWVGESDRVTVADPADAPAYAAYVTARAAALPAVADRSLQMSGRQPVWEIATRLLSTGYGRAGLALRLPVLDPAVRRLCRATRPSVVDGATGLDHWFRVDGALQKITADVRAFSNQDRSCYDPSFDLAGVDPGGRNGTFVAALQAAHPVDPERFLLYQLVHLQDPDSGRTRNQRASSRAVARYLAERLPALGPPADGPLCAIDIDGVLEAGAFGFSAITPTAVTALRALAAHGYRPVPVTGRSLDEVRERCEIFDLAGGVAEYGAVTYTHLDRHVRSLLPPDDQELVDRLRDLLRSAPDVTVDDDFRFSVRAYRAGARRGPVPASTLDTVLTALGTDRQRLRIIPGLGQTDIVAATIDKASGLAQLARLTGAAPVHLAVGDSASDVPMFALARHACAPANGDDTVRAAAGVQVLRSAYAAGLAEAAARVLGHRVGACPQCRPAPSSRETATLLAILDAQSGGRRGLPGAVLRSATNAIRSAGSGHRVTDPSVRLIMAATER
ncbi:HAD hydrolase family protein [Pseudonocardia sp. CA-142604]|uniref:HAD hydrolase family protein n=1 Tax=Pseudonocardia sp. CA-142604 TaxID=3240024 RepID=UPI003D8CEE2A